MPIRRTLALVTATGLSVLMAALSAPSASAVPSTNAPSTAPSAATLGTKSLAAVLTSDGNQFDNDWNDYDIATEAILAVIAAKPGSAVAVLANGSTPVTAFLPTDRAFQVLARNLTGQWIYGEKRLFNALVAAAGVDAIESILLYHVVPGATITSSDALRSAGAKLQTALPGATFKVNVISRYYTVVKLQDNDPSDPDPYLIPAALDINKGNRQIAHGITAVLRPLDLP
ncbi:MAG: fasciclin domain-containing protein [Lapillicoccus sp.]